MTPGRVGRALAGRWPCRPQLHGPADDGAGPPADGIYLAVHHASCIWME